MAEGIFLPFGIQDDWTGPIRRMATATRDFTRDLGKTTKEVAAAALGVNKAEGATVNWNKTLLKLTKQGLKGLRDFKVGDAINQFKDLSVLGIGVSEGLRRGAVESMEYGRALVDLRLSGRVSEEQLRRLDSVTKDLANDSEYSRTAILRSSTMLLKLGRDADQASKDVQLAGNFANVVGLSLEEGTSTLTRVSTMYFGSLDKMAEASDILALTAKRTNIPVQQLIGSLETLGPNAKASQTSLADTAGMLRIMTEAGMGADDATSALNRAMAASSKAGLPFNKALEMIRANFQAIKDPAARAAYLTEEFGARNAAKLAPIFEKNAEAFREYISASKDVANFTGKANDMIEDLPAEKFEKATNQIKESFIVLATPLVQGLAVIVTGFTKLPSSIRTTGVAFLTLLAASKPLMSIAKHFKELWIFGQKMLPALKNFGSTFASIGAKLGPTIGIIARLGGKFLGVVGTLWSLYDIVRLLKIGWDMLMLSFEKKGIDMMPKEQQEKMRRMQEQGFMDAQGGITAAGKAHFTQKSTISKTVKETSSTVEKGGTTFNGPVTVKVEGGKASDRESLVRSVQSQMKAKGK